MAYPAFQEYGTFVGQASVTSLDVPYTGNEAANDIVFLQILGWGTDVGCTTPTGWNLLSSVTGASDSPFVFWRRCDGTESGNVTVQFSASQNATGQMSRWSGCKTSGDPFEALTDTGLITDTQFDIASITTLGAERLAVCLIERYQITTEGTPTNYVQEFDNQLGAGQSQCFGYSQQIATAQTVSADSFSASASGNYHATTFALLPIVSSSNDLTSQNIASANPVVGQPSINQTQDLTSQNIGAQNPVINNSDLGQSHAVVSQDILSQNTEVNDSTLSQVHGLIAQNVENLNPVVDEVTIAQTHVFNVSNIDAQAPIIQAASLGTDNVNALGAQNIISQGSIVNNVVLNQVQILIIQSIISGNPIILFYNESIDFFELIELDTPGTIEVELETPAIIEIELDTPGTIEIELETPL